MLARWLTLSTIALATACGSGTPPPRSAASKPCYTVTGDGPIRSADATKRLDALTTRIQLGPEDEGLRSPKSIADVRKILQRDVIYLFPTGASFARGQNTLEGRQLEATLELLMGDTQLVASQVLALQASWVSNDLRVARAALATETGLPASDRGRALAQLVRAVEEGNEIADALGQVGPKHVARGAEVIRTLLVEAPNDPRTMLLRAEYSRLRGEWPEFETALKAVEASTPDHRGVCYLRAMEQVERFRKNDRGATMMRECLAKTPGFVRAQAALVLMARRPREAMRELALLKKINEDHYLVALLEPTLAADQELERAQGGEQPDAP
jgi:hypothetical protein